MTDQTTVEFAWCVGIRARYIGPSNTLGSRWRVWRADETWANDPDRYSMPYDYSLGQGADNAAEAIRQYLARKAERGHDWSGRWVVACGDPDSYVAVRVPDHG